jgi:hypothetical protein
MTKGTTTRRKSGTESLTAKRDALPFFSRGRRGEPALWWNVRSTGDYWKDRRTGQSYAAAVMPLMAHNGGPAMLSYVFGDMFKIVAKRRRKKGLNSEKLSGIEIGFITGLADLIVAGLSSTIACADPSIIRSRKRHRGIALRTKAAIDLHSTLAQNHWRVERERDDAVRAELAGRGSKARSVRTQAA